MQGKKRKEQWKIAPSTHRKRQRNFGINLVGHLQSLLIKAETGQRSQVDETLCQVTSQNEITRDFPKYE